MRFPEAIEASVEELMPNRITDYLYDLSEKFNGFYTECKVDAALTEVKIVTAAHGRYQNDHICFALLASRFACHSLHGIS